MVTFTRDHNWKFSINSSIYGFWYFYKVFVYIYIHVHTHTHALLDAHMSNTTKQDMCQIPIHWFQAGQEMSFHMHHFYSCGNHLSLLQQSLQIVTGTEKIIHWHWWGKFPNCFSKWTAKTIRKLQNLIKLNTGSASKSNLILFDTTNTRGNNAISLVARKL